MKDKRSDISMTTTANTSLPTPKHLGHGINYLGNEDFFSLISNTAGAIPSTRTPSSAASPATATTTCRWTTGDATSTSTKAATYGLPPGSLQDRTRQLRMPPRHELHPHHRTKDGIEASLLFFVPLKTWGEVQKLTLRNTSAKVRKPQTVLFCPNGDLWNGRYGHGELPA